MAVFNLLDFDSSDEQSTNTHTEVKADNTNLILVQLQKQIDDSVFVTKPNYDIELEIHTLLEENSV